MNPEIKSCSVYAISLVLALLKKNNERAKELKQDLQRNGLTEQDFEDAMDELEG